MEHLSEFRSTIHTVKYFLMGSEGLSEDYIKEVNKILYDINNTTLDYLSKKEYSLKELDILTHKVFEFVSDKNDFVPNRTREKVFRFMKDLHESIENLHSIHSHRTPISLKAYCEIFIYIFPLIYAPTIIYNIGLSGADWIAYFVVVLTQFILISLYNIQNQLEYPFDNIGMDDINLENFRIER